MATNILPPANTGFGTAQDMATLPGTRPAASAPRSPSCSTASARVDVIENQTLPIPGSIETYDLRAQNPDGPFGQPMLSLVSGRYPLGRPGRPHAGRGIGLRRLTVGDTWHEGGTARTVVGIVENPQSLLDEFALVVPGQVTSPTRVTVLFDARASTPASIGSTRALTRASSVAQPIPSTPRRSCWPLATLGMLLIGLVAVGGFTVLAQRRLRSIGMLGALGATDRDVRLVVLANGLVVGVVGTRPGAVIGASSSGSPTARISSQLPPPDRRLRPALAGDRDRMALAVVATYFAASRPARAMTRVPIVARSAGRPAPPRSSTAPPCPGHRPARARVLVVVFAGSRETAGGRAPSSSSGSSP